jgi:hypothetical protein
MRMIGIMEALMIILLIYILGMIDTGFIIYGSYRIVCKYNSKKMELNKKIIALWIVLYPLMWIHLMMGELIDKLRDKTFIKFLLYSYPRLSNYILRNDEFSYILKGGD